MQLEAQRMKLGQHKDQLLHANPLWNLRVDLRASERQETAASFRNNTEKFYTGTVPTTGWILSDATCSAPGTY